MRVSKSWAKHPKWVDAFISFKWQFFSWRFLLSLLMTLSFWSWKALQGKKTCSAVSFSQIWLKKTSIQQNNPLPVVLSAYYTGRNKLVKLTANYIGICIPLSSSLALQFGTVLLQKLQCMMNSFTDTYCVLYLRIILICLK